jgi:hypothetical protein
MNHENNATKSTKKSHSVAVAEAPPATQPAATVPQTPPVTPPGEMPPAVGAPAPPEGWKATPTKGRGRALGSRLKRVQGASQAAAAKELATSTTYVSDFGSRAPSPTVLGFLLSNAAAWRAIWDGATQFLAYAAEQRQKWEDAASAEMAALAPSFDFVASRDPAIAQKYAATAKYLGAASASAKRAVVTRKAKAAKAKKAEAAAPSATPAVNTVAEGKNVS